MPGLPHTLDPESLSLPVAALAALLPSLCQQLRAAVLASKHVAVSLQEGVTRGSGWSHGSAGQGLQQREYMLGPWQVGQVSWAGNSLAYMPLYAYGRVYIHVHIYLCICVFLSTRCSVRVQCQPRHVLPATPSHLHRIHAMPTSLAYVTKC